MRIHIMQFDERVGLGIFAGWLAELGGETTVWRCDRQEFPPANTLEPLVLLGGYMGVNDREQLDYLQYAADWLGPEVERGRPLLAICLGSQLLAHSLGGRVRSQSRQEKGLCEIMLTAAGQADQLFAGLPNPFISFEWHNDSFELPAGCLHLGLTEVCPNQAFRYRNAWGLQFHPEVDAQIVADWCQRTGAGVQPLEKFLAKQQAYFSHSKRLLENFLSLGEGLTSCVGVTKSPLTG